MAVTATRRSTTDRIDFIPDREYKAVLNDDGNVVIDTEGNEVRELIDDSPATFKLRYLSSAVADSLRSKIKQVADDNGNINMSVDMKTLFDIARKCLAGWENVNYPDGRAVIFKTAPDGSCLPELFEVLDTALQVEIGHHCMAKILFREKADSDHAKKLGN